MWSLVVPEPAAVLLPAMPVLEEEKALPALAPLPAVLDAAATAVDDMAVDGAVEGALVAGEEVDEVGEVDIEGALVVLLGAVLGLLLGLLLGDVVGTLVVVLGAVVGAVVILLGAAVAVLGALVAEDTSPGAWGLVQGGEVWCGHLLGNELQVLVTFLSLCLRNESRFEAWSTVLNSPVCTPLNLRHGSSSVRYRYRHKQILIWVHRKSVRTTRPPRSP